MWFDDDTTVGDLIFRLRRGCLCGHSFDDHYPNGWTIARPEPCTVIECGCSGYQPTVTPPPPGWTEECEEFGCHETD